jgi:hypothetical protein
MERIIRGLEKRYNKIKVDKNQFEHCGVKHAMLDNVLTVSMDEYVKELKSISITKEERETPHTGCCDRMHQDYISVVGGVGWLAQYRLDAAVYIGALQRASHGPTIKYVINLNRLLKWLRRKSGKTVYDYIPPPYRITCVSDSAFKATDKTYLACRGHLILLTHQDQAQPGGKCHILDAISRRQRRVNRSTFGAT